MTEELKEMVKELEEKNKAYGLEENLKIEFKEDRIEFNGEFDYEQGMIYADKLDKVLQKYHKDSYFDAECSGRWVAYLN